MASNGGTLTVDGAVDRPTQLLMSGPVAGIIGGIAVGRAVGIDSVITLDVGGTSADIGVAPDGQLRMKHLYDTNIGGYDVMVPMVDLDTIGAGGGSIARIDAGGMLRVGPQSAGAVPGPLCYGRGGTEPTATDAQVVLGRLRPQALSRRQPRAGRRAARARRSPRSAAARTSTSTRRRSASRRSSPRTWSTRSASTRCRRASTRASSASSRSAAAARCYGVEIARELSIPRVDRAAAPGHHLGDGPARVRPQARDAAHGHGRRADADPAALERVYQEMEAAGRERLDADGFAEAPAARALADCRYVGQAYELLVPVPAGPLTRPGSPASSSASRRPTSASTSTASRRCRCSSCICARTRSG